MNDSDVGVEEHKSPDPQTTFLLEMLRFVVFRLEIEVLALVVPLVGNIVPYILVVRLKQVAFSHALNWESANIVSRQVLGVVVGAEWRLVRISPTLEGLRVLVRLGYSFTSGVCFVVRVH